MIRDTCPCGAEFEVEHATASIPSSSEQNAHKQWLESHKRCRVEIDGVPTDRPECPKCGGTGMVKFDYGYQGFEMACDCKLDLRNCGAKPEGK